MRFQRRSGVLLHPTSLPSRYGIGDLGDTAYDFVDFLVRSGQSLWQILPLGPTGYGDSPYQCFSAFAGNPLLISPERLAAEGILPPGALKEVPDFPVNRTDFGWIIPYKNDLLRKALGHFQKQATPDQQQAFDAFCQEQAYWLDDFALFMALKNRYMEDDGGVWNTWPKEIAQRLPPAVRTWTRRLASEIAVHKFNQFLFFRQWLDLKEYANARGIEIVGDVPIFVAFDSADVWANPELFYLDEDGRPTVVAGVPPDYFSETGQRWGNPLYRWRKMAADGYAWWVKRLQMTFTQVDIVRIDHFRGFDAYWEIPATEETAVVGRWVKGPGSGFFDRMRQALGDLPIIAEDLGVITPGVEALRDQYDFPGMKILQFAFGGDKKSNFLPHNFQANCVVYTGTHDNETTLGWYLNASPVEQDHARRYVARDGHDIAWDMIRLALMSVADTAVVPLQDLMSLGNEARMNFPGKTGGWWSWRFTPGMLTEGIVLRLRELVEMYGRLPLEESEAEAEEITVEEADI
jgi:4-alpha-glucanotransferase